MGERLLVEVENNSQTVTSTGVIIPETANTSNDIVGKVLAVGAGSRTKTGETIPMSVNVGDIVLFPKSVASETIINGKKYLVVKESDTYGIVE